MRGGKGGEGGGGGWWEGGGGGRGGGEGGREGGGRIGGKRWGEGKERCRVFQEVSPFSIQSHYSHSERGGGRMPCWALGGFVSDALTGCRGTLASSVSFLLMNRPPLPAPLTGGCVRVSMMGGEPCNVEFVINCSSRWTSRDRPCVLPQG